MAGELNGRRVAILAADGVERVGLEFARSAAPSDTRAASS
jgi:hypothetical protein